MESTVAETETHPVALVRVRRPPPCEPPYDDERHPDSWLLLPQPELDLASLTAPATPARGRTGPAAPDPPTTVRTSSDGATPSPAAPTADGTGLAAARHDGGHPPAGEAVRRFLRTWLEIVDGYRPLPHARALVSPLDAAAFLATTSEVAKRFGRLRHPARPGATRARLGVRRVRLCQPRPGVAEVAAVITCEGRAWALALRLEHHQGRWLSTAVDVLWGNHPPHEHPD